MPGSIEFDGAAQVAQLRRTVTRNGKKTVEVVYPITREPATLIPATLAAWVRGHWEMRKPPSLGQGHSLPGRQITRQNGKRARVMAWLAAWPSACCASTATPTSPPPTATTPATPQRTLKLLQTA